MPPHPGNAVHRHRVAALTAALAVLLVVAAVPFAPGNASAAPAPDPGAFAAFLDEAVLSAMATHHVPGATAVVVQGGAIRAAKGYGVADIDRRVPFDPARSLVRIGSVTKLFTWTAVMQLVEQGRLDLHADINRYLHTFQIPDTFAEPITMAHLMSHTAGFEDRVIGIGARTPEDVPPLAEYLAAEMPSRVRPPGEMSAYSNYGAALAGQVVAEVSGVAYETYVGEHILGPLGMQHSTAEEPLPESLAGGLASSYDTDEDGTQEREPFVYDRLAPDGSISATATDMGRFMIAHLQDGRFEGARLLEAGTARLMHERSFAPHPEVDGWAHGFKERTFNGHKVLMHDGMWEGFGSALILVPDLDIGLFVSLNSTSGADALADLVPAFFARFTAPAGSSDATAATTPASTGVEGFYRLTRSSSSTIEKLLTLVGASRARLDDSGRLHFAGSEWVSKGAGTYREADGDGQLALVSGADGATYLVTDRTAYQRMAWYETIPANGFVLGAFALLTVTALIGWPVAALVRRRRHPTVTATTPLRMARWSAALAGVLGLVFLAVLVVLLLGGTSLLYGVPTHVAVLLGLPVAATALTVTSVVATVMAWRRGDVGLAARLHVVAVLVGHFGFVWFCLQWNLLGWRFG